MASQSLGLDTLELALPASCARLSPGFGWDGVSGETQRPERNLYLYSDSAGCAVHGRKAYLNSPDWTLELVPAGDDSSLRLRLSAGAYSDDNGTPLDCERLRSVVACAVGELRDRGLEADWQQARVARVDVCRNLDLSHSAPGYLDLWRGAAFAPGVVPLFEGSNSFRLTLSKASRWPAQWGVYDKGQELAQKLKKGRARASVPASNILRAELRLRYAAPGVALGVPGATLAELVRPQAFAELGTYYRASAGGKLLPMLTEDAPAPAAADDPLALLAAVLEELPAGGTLAAADAKRSRAAALAVFGFEGACAYYERKHFPPCDSDSLSRRDSKKSALRRVKAALRAEWNTMQARKPVPSGALRSERVKELRAALTA